MKLLFTDLDGTLLNRDKRISAEDLEAISRASRQGNITVISTGRSLSSARPYIEELASVQNRCYAITYNGGLIYDCTARKVIYEKTIPLPYVKYIFGQAEKFHIHCQTYEDGYVLASKDSEELREYASHTSMPFFRRMGQRQDLPLFFQRILPGTCASGSIKRQRHPQALSVTGSAPREYLCRWGCRK